ncbi:MAG TPA: hypothetical protein VN702_23285 [Acetobacteraceae bacterium]|nr:hypothetical protein [Acetobacteraceae bacterium]
MALSAADRQLCVALLLAGLAAMQSTMHAERLSYPDLRQFLEAGLTVNVSLEADTMGYHPFDEPFGR